MPGTFDIDLRPDDRVLLIGIPEVEFVRKVARRLTQGMVVGIGTDEEIRTARRALVDCDNVMFVPAADPFEIPWRDEFFSKIYAPQYAQAVPEMLRALAPDGCVYLSGDAIASSNNSAGK